MILGLTLLAVALLLLAWQVRENSLQRGAMPVANLTAAEATSMMKLRLTRMLSKAERDAMDLT